VAKEQAAHLCLLAGRIKEVQKVVGAQQGAIAGCNDKLKEHERTMAGLSAGIATGVAALAGVEMRADKKLADSIRAVDSKVATNRSDISAARSDIASIRSLLAKGK
jgi:hypothetical protein